LVTSARGSPRQATGRAGARIAKLGADHDREAKCFSAPNSCCACFAPARRRRAPGPACDARRLFLRPSGGDHPWSSVIPTIEIRRDLMVGVTVGMSCVAPTERLLVFAPGTPAPCAPPSAGFGIGRGAGVGVDARYASSTSARDRFPSPRTSTVTDDAERARRSGAPSREPGVIQHRPRVRVRAGPRTKA
jgi:hypothetical protein